MRGVMMIKIYFIDDNTNLLNGLKRTLRVKKNDWDMAFFSSASDALDEIKKTEPNVVVSDYKMPGMTGVELMEILKKEYPKIKRIMLSGQYREDGLIEQLEKITDLLIIKPCEADRLIKEINKLI